MADKTALQEIAKCEESVNLWMMLISSYGHQLYMATWLTTHDIVEIMLQQYNNMTRVLAMELERLDVLREAVRMASYRTYLCAATLQNRTLPEVLDRIQLNEFLYEFGISAESFELLYEDFYELYSNSHSGLGRPPKFTPRELLALTIAYLRGKGMMSHEMALAWGATKSIISRAVWKGLSLLQRVLCMRPEAELRMPTAEMAAEWTYTISSKDPPPPGFEHVRIACFVDGVALPLFRPGDVEEQRKYWSAWKHMSCVNNLLVFSPDGCVAWAKLNQYGTANDSGMAAQLYEILQDPAQWPPGYGVVGDSIFKQIEGVFYRVRRNGEVVGMTAAAAAAAVVFDAWLVRIRQAVEWGMGIIEKTWRRVTEPLPLQSRKRLLILDTVIRLHNFRTRRDGRNQIATVYGYA